MLTSATRWPVRCGAPAVEAIAPAGIGPGVVVEAGWTASPGGHAQGTPPR